LPRRLVVIRHAKSDWSTDADDRARPIGSRGRKQAPAIGDFLRENDLVPDRVFVSSAKRARQTWSLIAEALGKKAPKATVTDDAYTFDGVDLVRLLKDTPGSVQTVAIVSHNPAVEELVDILSDRWVKMPTSSLVVLRVPKWKHLVPGDGEIAFAGRPADMDGMKALA
jgi:phosphohistidine phosphatase